MKKIIICLIIMIICGCSSTTKEEVSLEKIVEEGNYIILDVRSIHEYKDNHIENAINIPHDKIDSNIDLDKDKVILVYCRSGSLSKIASSKLQSLGYTTYDLGGMDEIEVFK